MASSFQSWHHHFSQGIITSMRVPSLQRGHHYFSQGIITLYHHFSQRCSLQPRYYHFSQAVVRRRERLEWALSLLTIVDVCLCLSCNNLLSDCSDDSSSDPTLAHLRRTFSARQSRLPQTQRTSIWLLNYSPVGLPRKCPLKSIYRTHWDVLREIPEWMRRFGN